MRIVRAEAMGMCFGVKDAIAAAASIARPAEVTIHGELVHNNEVNGRLSAAGFTISGEVGRNIPATPAVMITAHGVSNRERTALTDAGKHVIDTTCPLVRRAHDTALRLAREHWHVVIAGKRGHVEVTGLSGDLDSYTIIENAEQAQRLPFQRIALICQTTLQPSMAIAIFNALRRANPHAETRLFDTICRPTRDRQAAMARLLPQVEAVVVVGGAHSNNTRQLVNLARTANKPVVHVQSPDQVDRAWATQFKVIGVTAGTSTPDDQIEAVCSYLEAIQPDDHAAMSTMSEVVK